MKITGGSSRHYKNLSTHNNEPDLNYDTGDTTLWQGLTQGNKSDFELLYYRYINQLYDYGVRLAKDPQLAEDCIQELFAYLWENRQKLPDVRAVKPYLLVSLKRRVFRKLAEQKRDLSKMHELLNARSYSFDPSPNEQTDGLPALKEAFDRLSEKQKEVVYLRFYNQLTYEEIAEVMNVQVKAIYKLMGRAIAHLRNGLEHPIVAQLLLAILAT